MRDAGERSVAVGFFDGVHLGHRAVIDAADEVLTFRNHPLSVLRPGSMPPLITDFETRVRMIGKPVTVLEFTKELAAMPPGEFAERFFRRRRVVCGEDWRFGRNGEGDAGTLRSLGYEVLSVPHAMYRGERISSSRIRECLEKGDIESANAMLGRPYSMMFGRVRGKGEGTKLGYPTVNLRRGVYAVEADGKAGVANFGFAPTFGVRAWKEPTLEVHFLKFLRDERKFSSAEELKEQIAKDVSEAENGIF
ncbi:MAG: hypothetical protein ILO34_01480 [Kiritimatiellae bacterium]|nr:hypothetical protein [Kiritimatiellia bacterium]